MGMDSGTAAPTGADAGAGMGSCGGTDAAAGTMGARGVCSCGGRGELAPAGSTARSASFGPTSIGAGGGLPFLPLKPDELDPAAAAAAAAADEKGSRELLPLRSSPDAERVTALPEGDGG